MTDYTPDAIEARLSEVVRQTDLRADRRLHPKVDYSPAAVERRLRQVEALRRACIVLGDARPID